MNIKILVEVYVKKLNKTYDVFVPTNKTIHEISGIISSSINKQTHGDYKITEDTTIYDKENRKNLEGGNVNGENHISQRLRLSDTRLNSENKAASELGQIRNNENELSKRTQERTIYGVNGQRDTDRALTGNREISTKEIRTDSNETSRTESSKREDETRKSNAWVGLMNNFKNQAEEIIYQEIIYN